MNPLCGGLPTQWRGMALTPDFRNLLRCEAALRDKSLGDAGKAAACLGLLYRVMPQNVEAGLRGFLWIYSCGKRCGDARETDGPAEFATSFAARNAFCFGQDAPLILAAFRAVYGIDLVRVPFLHWWEFCALLEGLPPECLFCRVVYWRGVNLADVPQAERAFVRQMKRRYALKRGGGENAGQNAKGDMLAWAEERFKEARLHSKR